MGVGGGGGGEPINSIEKGMRGGQTQSDALYIFFLLFSFLPGGGGGVTNRVASPLSTPILFFLWGLVRQKKEKRKSLECPEEPLDEVVRAADYYLLQRLLDFNPHSRLPSLPFPSLPIPSPLPIDSLLAGPGGGHEKLHSLWLLLPHAVTPRAGND